MAICYQCKEQFYGYKCNNCDWIASYKCFRCKTPISPITGDVYKCNLCGWYSCPACDACGCGSVEDGERSMSNEEKQRVREGVY